MQYLVSFFDLEDTTKFDTNIDMELIQLEQQVNIHKQIVEAMKEQVQLAQEKEVAELEVFLVVVGRCW